jgi:hypothetical protein
MYYHENSGVASTNKEASAALCLVHLRRGAVWTKTKWRTAKGHTLQLSCGRLASTTSNTAYAMKTLPAAATTKRIWFPCRSYG